MSFCSNLGSGRWGRSRIWERRPGKGERGNTVIHKTGVQKLSVCGWAKGEKSRVVLRETVKTHLVFKNHDIEIF